MTAADIAKAVRAGTTTASAVTSRALEQANDSQERLNAFTLIDDAGATTRAATIDAMVERGVDPGPLGGVPIAVKDIIDQAGLPNTAGSSFYRSTPDRNADVIESLEAAGAVIIGRTGLHEFAFGYSSENHWFGPVHNPWDPATSPGGSSGGSAAVVAAGIVPLAIGTDTGGSVRVPAALCGVIGLKTSFGRVPLEGVFPLAQTLDTVGPIARSVEDAALAFRVMSGSHQPQDVSLDGLRVGTPLPMISEAPLDASVEAALADFAGALTASGATVTEITLPSLIMSDNLMASIYWEVGQVHRRFTGLPETRYGPEVKVRMRQALQVTEEQYRAGLEWRSRLVAELAEAFGAIDVLVTPTVGAMRKEIGSEFMYVDGGPVPYRQVLSWFVAPVNHAGLPALSFPIAGAGSPPPSVQLVGPMNSEELLLAVARSIDQAGLIEHERPR